MGAFKFDNMDSDIVLPFSQRPGSAIIFLVLVQLIDWLKQIWKTKKTAKYGNSNLLPAPTVTISANKYNEVFTGKPHQSLRANREEDITTYRVT